MKSKSKWTTTCDSIIAYLLTFNEKHPVKYKDKWIAKGELEKLLDSLPTHKQPNKRVKE